MKIDIDKLICSWMEARAVMSDNECGFVQQALREQGLAYKDGKIEEYKSVPKKQATGVSKNLIDLNNKAIDRVNEILKDDIFTYNDCECVTLSDAEECYSTGWLDAVDEACEYLYQQQLVVPNMVKFIEDFKKHMEEQQ